MRRIAIIAVLGFVGFTVTLGAQSKPPADFADYGQWETLARGGASGGLSPDGRWLAYGINRSDRNNELRILNLADNTTKVVSFGTQPSYSSDSKWCAYRIGLSEAEQERLRNRQRPVQNKCGLLNLATEDTLTFEGIQSFSFSPDGAYLLLQRYPAERASDGNGAAGRGVGGGRGARGGRGPQAPSEDAPGTVIIVRRLADGHETTFGDISQFAWQNGDTGHLLAMIVSAEGKTGNGVALFDPETGVLRTLDSSASLYTDLAWRKDALDLAVLRARTDDRKEGSTYVVLAWTGIGTSEHRHTYDPATDSSFPAGMRTVAFRRLSWSDDGKAVFLGIAPWEEKIGPPPERGGRNSESRRGTRGSARSKLPAVDIWHWTDVVVQPKQKVDAASDRRRNTLAAWRLDSGKLVELGKDPVNEEVRPIRNTNLAWAAEWTKYAMDRTIGRPASDLYLEDITTGQRNRVRDNVIDRYVQTGPAGKYLLFLQDDQYYTVNLATRAVTNISKAVATSFIDKESDQTVKQKPPFGVAGWTKDDAAVLLYDKFDIWRVPADGSKAQRLTNGAADEVRHRIARLDGSGGGRMRFFMRPPEEPVDLSKPVYVSLYGEWSKKFGYGLLKPGGGVDRLVWLDKNVGSLAKAKEAEVYAYTIQDFDDSPDIFIGGPGLKDAKQATGTNPFQSKFAWGHSELVEYKLDDGRTFQGALYYPAGYEQGKKYPMIVYMYEKLTQGVHNYVSPSDTSYYNVSVFTSQGYFVFEPDIVFTPRQPGVSVVECVVPGVKKVVSMGMIDPKRVGCVGHSWGGFDSAYLAANTQGVFAAAVAGAPLTDLVSMYGDHHWGPGIAETDHIETGQERMVVPLWEDLKAYTDNSAILNVQNMTVPLLLEEGDADGTVFWHQSVEMYNIARRAKKSVVFLVYNGEDHGLRQRPNQTDYQHRILAWFGHYLKGEPAESWITEGRTYLEREKEEAKRLAAPERTAPMP